MNVSSDAGLLRRMCRGFRKESIVAATFATGAIIASVAPALAQTPGYGRGMMGGYGMGSGMMQGNGPANGASPRQGNAQADLDLSSPGAHAFAANCGACHALPNPQTHTADQWPAVVARMERYMRDSHRPYPDDAQTREIDHFLEQHALAAK
jgi:cytochrome c553